MKLTENDILLFSGDSITDGNRARIMDCNDVMGHGYQTIIASKLALENAPRRPKFINKGHSGFTMTQLDQCWEEDVLAFRPTIVSILAGVNDGYFGFLEGKTPVEIAQRYEIALEDVIRKTYDELGKIRFIVVEPFYFPLPRDDFSYKYTPHPDCEAPFQRPDFEESDASIAHRKGSMPLLQQAAKRAAARNGCLFVETQKPMQAVMDSSRTEYLVWDGTHPTIAGHALLAQSWMQAMR